MYCLISVPDDYVTSTQEEKDVIEVLCMKEGVPQITLLDSDSDIVPPMPAVPRRTPKARLKLSKASGEFSFKLVEEVK